MKRMRGLALILGSKPPTKGSKASKDMARPGLRDSYLDEVKEAFKDRDEDAFATALEGLVSAIVREES